MLRVVFEEQSISQAAERLILSQSAVSLQIDTLERHFGARLFVRQGKRQVATEAGRLAYESAVSVLQQLDDAAAAIRDLQEARRGSLTIGGSVTVGSYLLPGLLASFQGEHPEVRLVLQVLPADDMFELITRGELEFGVTPEHELPGHLASERLRQAEVVVIASAQSEAARRRWTASELAREPFVCAPTGSRGRDQFDRLLAGIGIVREQVIMELGHPEGIKRTVEAGLGLAVTFRFVVEAELAAGRLVEVQATGLPMVTSVNLVHRPAKYFSPLAQALIANLRGHGPLDDRERDATREPIAADGEGG